MTAAGGARGGGRLWVGVLVVLVVVIGLVAASGRDTGEPYDLDDPRDAGYKGLRLLLEGQGATIDRVDAADVTAQLARSADVVFVPVAIDAGAGQAERWADYARSGGTLVLGTPRADIGPQWAGEGDFGFGFDVVATPRGACDIRALVDARDVDPTFSIPLEVPFGAESCFGDGDTALVVREVVGEGEIVTLATPDLFVNVAMRPHDQDVDDPKAPMRDNVVVATRLLNPGGGATVAVVTSGIATAVAGDTELGDLIRPGVQLGIWQLIAAFVIFAWYRGRRFGRVVDEPQPVAIAGSELVAAVGNLMERRHDPARAAWLLQQDTTRELAMRLGVPRNTDVSVVAAMIAARTGRDPAAVLRALSAAPSVTTDDELLVVAAQLEAIRQEVLHGRRTAPADA